jgi:hypothetical protein
MIPTLSSNQLVPHFTSQQHKAFPASDLTRNQTAKLLVSMDLISGEARKLGTKVEFLPKGTHAENAEKAQLVTRDYVHDDTQAHQLTNSLKKITGVPWQATPSSPIMLPTAGYGTYNITPIPPQQRAKSTPFNLFA